ncbi:MULTISPECIES: hypothetical protein [Halorubrum]|uniref:hypothetical protein n=1 Tax=Halorubrum TaxID=56688 RepID=UPI000F85914A|nr:MULTISPECIES: hypothetical protein [Halorubrum]AZQ15004.1 hypothetical protein DOS48_09295 [Halorubrum sp. PV6]
MHSTNGRPSSVGRSPGPSVGPEGSLRGSVAFLALVAVAILAVSYPLASLVALAGLVALGILARSLARHVNREVVGHVTLPGLGTVEYRFTR